MIRFIFAAFLFFSASWAQAGEGFGTQNAGEWRGVGLQDGSEGWVVLLSVTGAFATVEYPDFPCGGRWEYGVELGQSLSAIERLEFGQSLCFDNSHIEVERTSKAQLIVRWEDEYGAEIGFAVLHRNDPTLNNLAHEQAETALTRMSRNLGLRSNSACLPPMS